MRAFQYEAPTSLEGAVELLRANADALPLAGGTDLLVQIRGGMRQPASVVDLKHVPELTALEVGAKGARIGAAVSCWELCLSAELRAAYPGLVEAAELIGSMQIQGRATLGGNVCNGSPAADTTPALLALGARCAIAGPDGARTVPVAELLVAPGRTALARGEVLVAFEIDPPAPRSADAYLRFIPRGEMDIAVVGAGVSLALGDDGRCREAHVALGAVAPTALLAPEAAEALVGTSLDAPALAEAAARAREIAAPIDDKRGTAPYRRHLAGVLVERAAAIAARRAGERS